MANLIDRIRAACSDPEIIAAATRANALFLSYVDNAPRLPGAGTIHRLCVRIADGMTEEEAAAREYAYRWHLPLNQWVNFAETDKPRSRNGCRCHTGAWPVPHTIGL